MRLLSPELVDALTSAHVRPFQLVELDFEDGPVRATSLPFDITLEGATYLGVSVLGSVSPVTEGPEMRSYGTSLTLSGIPSSFAEYLCAQKVQGRIATLSAGFLNRNDQIIGEILPVFRGRMDTLDLKVGTSTEVSIAVETLFIDWERPRLRRYTLADQKVRFPADLSLEHVADVASKELVWGRY
jgi:hypothetical protein